jgi:hypothetical protein
MSAGRSGGSERPGDDAGSLALVLAVIGLLGCFPVAFTALAVAYNTRDRIRRAGGDPADERTLQRAIVLGWVGIGVAVVAFGALGVAAIVRGGV